MAYTTIDDPTIYFNTLLYTGNGSNPRTLTGVGFQPDWVWLKSRSDSYGHTLADAVRGANKTLSSDGNGAEITDKNDGHLDAFASDGFTVGAGTSSAGRVNISSDNYVAWNWKESATAGFDICSWTGNGSAQNISHNLSKVPTMIIVKNRTDAGADWYCYNVHNGNTHSILLNTNGAKVGAYSDNWNNTTPTSSVFTVGSSNSTGGSSGDNMIAYVFTDIKGYSKFGSYTGNNNADGPFVYTGFRPAFIMMKSTSAGGDNAYSWSMFDNKRSSYNIERAMLKANLSDVEYTSGSNADVDILSNGFKMRASPNETNGANTYIYMAFAESPFVNSNGVPNNAR